MVLWSLYGPLYDLLCDLSIERVCLGTNMADSNRRQGRSHVGENQEFRILQNSRRNYTPPKSNLIIIIINRQGQIVQIHLN